MVALYCLRNFENTNIFVYCLQSRVKVIGNKGEDTSKMGVTSKEKDFFSKNVTFFKQMHSRLVSRITSFK